MYTSCANLQFGAEGGGRGVEFRLDNVPELAILTHRETTGTV
jgi:hypothetical protein